MFDITEFQQEIYQELKSVKFRLGEDSVNLEPKSKQGLFERLLNAFGDKLNKLFVKSNWFKEIESKVEAIIEDPKTKSELCEKFQNRISPDFFKEELEVEVVLIVTSTLRNKYIKENVSKEDKFLFALIVYKILKIGTDNYCSSLKQN